MSNSEFYLNNKHIGTIHYPPPTIVSKSVDDSHLTGGGQINPSNFGPQGPVAKMQIIWQPTGNRSTVSIWQVHPYGWNYSDDHIAGKAVECRELKWILWNFGLSDADPNIQEWIEEVAEWC